MRPGIEAAGENDSRFGRVHGGAHVPRMDDVAAVEQIVRIEHRGNRHFEGADDSRRGSLRPRKGEGAHPRLSRSEETAAGDEGSDTLLPRASWGWQDFAR